MGIVTAVLIHLPSDQVRERLELLSAVAPHARFVVCYGGERSEFDRIALEHKLFIDEPTLRGPEQHLQSLTRTFQTVWDAYFASDPSSDALYLIEYDHLVLDEQFEAQLADLAQRSGADLMGKNCVDCTATNSAHYVRFRRDPRLHAHLRRLSVRDDPSRLFSCLGDGIWMSRRALQAYVGVAEHPPCYCEIYVPTLLHHLGFRVVNVDAYGDLYSHVRWIPPFDTDEVIAGLEAGVVFMHPVKDHSTVRAVAAALGDERVWTGAGERIGAS